MDLERARLNMIEGQIRPWNVLDASVLHLLSVVKREDFCPLAHRGMAFIDMEIPLQGTLEQAQQLGQCMLAPRVEARMLQEANVQKHESVLEVGAGSGYMAALLGHRAQRVLTLEIDPLLAKVAQANLKHAGVPNVTVRNADASLEVMPEGPFDLIMLSGSVPEVPPALLAQLKSGGRLLAIVGDEPIMCATLVTRLGEASYASAQPWDTLAPRLRNFGKRAAWML